MNVLVFSDIHGNLNALESVLKAAGSFDAAWCLGDLVGYGPDPNECIEYIRDLPNLQCVMGNHDAAGLGKIDLDSFNHEARFAARWLKENLTMESVQFLSGLPQRIETMGITLCHGSPRNPIWEYLLDLPTVLANLAYLNTDICFTGHTHIPVVFRWEEQLEWFNPIPGKTYSLDATMIINPGSVGQPRDHDPRASFLKLDTETRTWELFRVEYDIPSVQERIRKAGLPKRLALRLAEGW